MIAAGQLSAPRAGCGTDRSALAQPREFASSSWTCGSRSASRRARHARARSPIESDFKAKVASAFDATAPRRLHLHFPLDALPAARRRPFAGDAGIRAEEHMAGR